MKKALLIIIISCTALQMQAQRLYVQYKFNPELQTLLANPDKKALYETYAAQPINATDRAEYTAVQLRFTDDTGTQELARYSLSPSRLEQLWSSLYDAGKLPFVSTEEEFLDLNDPHFVGLTAQSFDVISRLIDQLVALPIDERLSIIDNFLHTEIAHANTQEHTSLFGLTLQLIQAAHVMGLTPLEREITSLILTPTYLATFGQEPLATETALSSINALISNAYQATIVMPNARNERTLRKKDVISARFSPNGRFVAGMHLHGAAYVWDLVTDEVINIPTHISPGSTNSNTAVYFSPDSHFMATVDADKQLYLWDLTKGAALCNPENVQALPRHEFPIVAAHFSPDSRTITTVCGTRTTSNLTIQTWDLYNTAISSTKTTIFLHDFNPRRDLIHFSPDGRLLVVVVAGQYPSIFDLTKGETINNPENELYLSPRGFSGITPVITSVCFSPDSQTIAGTLTEGTVCIWDLKNGKTNRTPIIKMRGDHPNLYSPYLSIDFSPDGRYLIAGACDGTAHVWQVDRDHGHFVTSLYGHASSGVMSRIGIEMIVIMKSMEGIGLLPEHAHMIRNSWRAVSSAQFSPTGNAVVTTGVDETVRVWNIDPALQTVSPLGQLLLLACAQKTQFSPQQLKNLHDTYVALPTAAKELIDTSLHLRFARLDVTNAVSKVVQSATTGLSWLKGAARSLASLITRRTSTSSGRQAAPAIAAIGSTAPTAKKADNSNSTILEEQMADLIKRKNFEVAETLFEKYPELIRSSTHYKEFAQAIADWRARNGHAGSSSSSSTDR